MRFYGRSEQLEAARLGLAAAEHVLFWGPPGTAKTALIRAIAEAAGVPFFWTQAHQFSTPEDFFGPLDVPALKEGRMVRLVDGFLPSATVAFIDEIGKAGVVLNALLRIMEERVYSTTPPALSRIPLVSLFAATNESLSANPALYDRFLIRVPVLPLSRADWMNMMKENGAGENIANVQVDIFNGGDGTTVTIPADVIDLMIQLRDALADMEIEFSDRRWVKLKKVVRANAVLRGDSTVQSTDLQAARFVLWNTPEQYESVRLEILKLVAPEVARAREMAKEVEDLFAEAQSDSQKWAQVVAKNKAAIDMLKKHRQYPEVEGYLRTLAQYQVQALEQLGIRNMSVEAILGLGGDQ